MRGWYYISERGSFKTQKALSLRDLAISGSHTFPCTRGAMGDVTILPQHAIDTGEFPAFARPCPLTPRHGFVDSRVIYSKQEAVDLFAEVKKEDPEGELALMPVLTGKYSGVATNAGVTWGHSNDGVTSGKGENVLIPTPTTQLERWNYHTRINLTITDAAYIELVENAGDISPVQVRNGPALPNSPDYIPRTEVVSKVLPLNFYSLLAWEQYLKEQIILNGGKPDGLAITAQGIPLSSHYAVHGVELGIPVITSYHLKTGDRLYRAETTTKELLQGDYNDIVKLIQEWEARDYISPIQGRRRATVLTAIASVHTMQHWGNSPHLLALRAVAMVTLLRYLSAATMGEMRYWYTKGPGREEGKPATKMSFNATSKERDQIYTYILAPFPINKMLNDFRATRKDFNTYFWRGQRDDDRESGSTYGGRKWGNVSKAGADLASAVLAFIASPSKQTWSDVVLRANIAIHTAHNNGFVMNKWVSGDIFRKVAECPGLGLINSFAAQVALGLKIDFSKINDELNKEGRDEQEEKE